MEKGIKNSLTLLTVLLFLRIKKRERNGSRIQTFVLLLLGNICYNVIHIVRHNVALFSLWTQRRTINCCDILQHSVNALLLWISCFLSPNPSVCLWWLSERGTASKLEGQHKLTNYLNCGIHTIHRENTYCIRMYVHALCKCKLSVCVHVCVFV